MTRLIFTSLLCSLLIASYAQQGTQKGNIDVTNFPEVSFFWNEYNPEIIDPAHFSVKENQQEFVAKIENIKVEEIPQKQKSILFLWEDQPQLNDMFAFIEQLLFYFFRNDIADDKTTEFNIATFNQREGDKALLNIGLENFTSDKSALMSFIQTAYDRELSRKGQQGKSNLISAIKEGLDLIEKEPNEKIRAIFVITAGNNLFVPGEELTPLINRSLTSKIPVYVINYHSTDESKTITNTVERLYSETFGQLIAVDGKTDPEAKSTRNEMLKCFNDINSRHYGQDYKITFQSNLKRDGKAYPLTLNYNGFENNIVPYQVPSFSLSVWIKENMIIFVLIIIVTVVIVAMLVFLRLKSARKKRDLLMLKEAEEAKQKAKIKAEQDALNQQLKDTEEQLKAQQEQQRRDQIAAEQEKLAAVERERQEQLMKQMQIKNLFPRLIDENDNQIKFNIGKIVTTIGRAENHDIVLHEQTVSSNHAKIIFNGEAFEIHDTNSSNGTIVNGYKINSAILKHLDIIQFGNIFMKFYL